MGEVYIRHPPSYRSDVMTKFVNKLDLRSKKRHIQMSHPRIERWLGSPVSKPIPPHDKKWMLSKRDGDVGSEDDEFS